MNSCCTCCWHYIVSTNAANVTQFSLFSADFAAHVALLQQMLLTLHVLYSSNKGSSHFTCYSWYNASTNDAHVARVAHVTMLQQTMQMLHALLMLQCFNKCCSRCTFCTPPTTAPHIALVAHVTMLQQTMHMLHALPCYNVSTNDAHVASVAMLQCFNKRCTWCTRCHVTMLQQTMHM